MASGSVAKKLPNDTPVQKEVKQTESPKATTGEISRLRRRIAENMVMSKQTSAHVMTSVEVDYENVEILIFLAVLVPAIVGFFFGILKLNFFSFKTNSFLTITSSILISLVFVGFLVVVIFSGVFSNRF